MPSKRSNQRSSFKSCPRVSVGIVGCGTIGSELAQWLTTQLKNNASLVALHDLDTQKASQLKQRFSLSACVVSLEELVEQSDLVIEAAHLQAVAQIAKQVFQNKKDLLVMSVGGLVKNPELLAMVQEHGSHVYIPSGAIGGLDALKAAALSKVEKVVLTTRKSPLALADAPYWKEHGKDWHQITQETLLFEGKVDQAIRLFPNNLNVSATLQLAVPTVSCLVRIVAVPGLTKNVHQIEVTGETGKMVFQLENQPAPGNPRTSYLAVLSAKALLKEIFSSVKIGN